MVEFKMPRKKEEQKKKQKQKSVYTFLYVFKKATSMFRCELLQFLEPAEMVKVSMLSAEIHKIVDENYYKYRLINQQQVRNRWEMGTE